MRWKAAPGDDALPPLRVTALVVTRDGKLALTLAGPDRWHESQGYVFMPAELPGVALDDADEADDLPGTRAALALRAFGCPVPIQSSRCVYGPSTAHAIDRLSREPDEHPAPLLRLERGTPLAAADGLGLRRVELRCFLARLSGDPLPVPDVAGILWLTPASLRSAMRGLPFADLVALRGVEWHPAGHYALPDEAFLYVPGEYGERHLVRIAAKYGPAALFQDGEAPPPPRRE